MDDDQPFSTKDLKVTPVRIVPSREWRDRLDAAKKMTADELCDVVYALALEGAPLTHIAAYYGLDHRELGKVAGDAWNVANAELIIAIFRDQIMTALHTKQMLAKIYVGKQFAGQRDSEPLTADMSSLQDAGGLTINLNVTKAKRDENGKTEIQGDPSAGPIGTTVDGNPQQVLAEPVASSIVVNT
jgi:hypothetical protein